MKPFGELLSLYIERAGMSDAELARRLGVSRQTIFRWREGLTDRPRQRDDVIDISSALRLSQVERDELLLAAGFSPESSVADATPESTGGTPGLEDPNTRTRRRRWAIALTGLALMLLVILAVAVVTSSPSLPESGRADSFATATSNETLILISPFASYGGELTGFNVAGRLQEALLDEFAASNLEAVRIEVLDGPLAEEPSAVEIGKQYGAKFVVWGEYDSGRVLAFVTPLAPNQLSTTQERRWILSTEGELLSTINSDLPDEVRWLALYILGQTQLQAGMLEGAQVSLERALAIPPKELATLGGVYFQLGLLENRRNEPDVNTIIALYTEALELQPGHLSALNNRAIAYLERGSVGDVERAETDLRSAVSLDPSDPLYLANLAQTLARKGSDHLEEAIGLLVQAEGLVSESGSLQNSLCWFHSLNGSPGLAMPHCDQAVELDPSGYSNDSRGLALALLGRFDEAAQEFRAFLDQLDQEDRKAYERFSPSRLGWIDSLESGRDPFDAATLEELLEGSA